MLTLKEIAAKIRELIGEDKKARPFLCEGSPIGCEVFIIGHNPAVTTTFWDCWDDQYGCNRSKWIENYQKEGSATGKRTRENTEKLIDLIKPYRVLDTNICHKNAPKFDQNFKDECGTKVCDYLLEIIGPKLIFVHGKFAIEHLAELAKLPKEVLIESEFTPLTLFGKRTWIFRGFYHLARQWGPSRIQETGQRIHEWCKEHNLSKV